MRSDASDDLDLNADYISIDDIIERIEYLEGSEMERKMRAAANVVHPEIKELRDLMGKLACGGGGDVEWEDQWYPNNLIRDSYMMDYAKEYASEMAVGVERLDGVDRWPYNHIDWDAALEAFKEDYTTVKVDGVTYYYR